jgi:hypothetical protein
VCTSYSVGGKKMSMSRIDATIQPTKACVLLILVPPTSLAVYFTSYGDAGWYRLGRPPTVVQQLISGVGGRGRGMEVLSPQEYWWT